MTKEKYREDAILEFKSVVDAYKAVNYPCLTIRYGRWGRSPYNWTMVCRGCGKNTRKFLLMRPWCEYTAKHKRSPKSCSSGRNSLGQHPIHHTVDVPICSEGCKTLFLFKYNLA